MLVLHIGLPKTGTTLLQYRILRPARNIAYVHRARSRAGLALARALRHHAQSGLPLAALERGPLAAWLGRLAEPGRPLVVSDESVSLVQFRFWASTAAGPACVAARLAALAARLPAGLGPARVLLGIRRQDQWLASSYAHCAELRRGFGQADFDHRLRRIADGVATPALGWLDYAAAHRAFAEAFGPENVHLASLESLSAAPEETVAAIARFAGLARFRGAKPVGEASHRRAVEPGSWRTGRSGGLLRLDPGLAAAVRARFGASNRELAAITPLGFEP